MATTQSKTQTLISWLVARPALFAITSAIFISVFAGIYGIITHIWPELRNIYYILISSFFILAFLASTTILVRGLPPQNLDRRSFVAIINAQTLIVAFALAILTFVIYATKAQIIIPAATIARAQSDLSFMALLIGIGLCYLYLIGLHIAGLYAKYRRIRAMGVPMWRIICTIPFGFTMLWIPGYILPAPTPKKPALQMGDNWYARLTDWIISSPIKTAIAFVILAYFIITKLVLGLAVVCTIWVLITGIQKFRDNIAGLYTWAAVGLNILAWIAAIFIITHMYTPEPINVTISDVEQVQEIIE